ncbi:EscU/YscU/HrcU family type III secretion system export apparatus switch protein [Nocardioides houyundeii]|uniref:EscU/YscU/HrcU family type III secretion system export apparatus switch protein n=1 Tax=Nocardioides houyundeii TaxID=2045452 RepID=UPI000C7767E1|nr:EscU/YscU/HrcU family type III secretion system export apparatus switch protein [Nocardioides houyundeii]
MSGEKTEKPTARKNKENRKEGQVPRTQELGGWASMLLVGMALPMLLGRELTALQELMVTCLNASGEPDPEVALQLMGQGLTHVAKALLLLSSGVLVVGVAAALAQGGFYLATKAVKPKFSKLNPISGAKRVFGPQALWEGAKMLLKSSLVGILAYAVVKSMMPMLGGLVPIPVVLEVVADEALGLIRNVAIAGLVMAAADYMFQRRKMGKQTRMTKEEVKQEYKNTEGDPLLKSAIRSRQLATSRNRMMADVATADVVLVNPTHVAVALRYESERGGAPLVVARGAGAVATRIREEAAAHRVPLVRDVPLARALHGATKVGQEIPPELFGAVAQVLAFVISRRTRGHHGGEHRSPRAEQVLPDVLPVGRRRRNPSDPPPPGR